MLDPIFSRRHRNPGAWDIPRTPTNEERVQRYRAVAPVTFWNERFAQLPASKVLRDDREPVARRDRAVGGSVAGR